MQSDQSLCWSLEYSMTVKLLTEQHLEFLSLLGGCKGSSVYPCQDATLLVITCHSSVVQDGMDQGFRRGWTKGSGGDRPVVQEMDQWFMREWTSGS